MLNISSDIFYKRTNLINRIRDGAVNQIYVAYLNDASVLLFNYETKTEIL